MSEKIPLIFAPGITSGYYVSTFYHRGTHGPLLRAIERAGFDPHFFQPDWRDPRPLAWAAGMADFAADAAQTHGSEQVVLAGFSCGALIATLAASEMEKDLSEIEVAGLAACSLSPWFGLDRIRRAREQPSDLHDASEALSGAFSELELPKLSCPVQLYAGTQEYDTVLAMHEDALEQWPQARSIKPPTVHNIFAEPYLQAIEKNIGLLAPR